MNIPSSIELHSREYCLNSQVYNIEEIDYIVVGDNPGREEFCKKEYFIGPSGQALRKCLIKYLYDDNNRKESRLLFRNKTVIYTDTTAKLHHFRNRDLTLFNKLQTECAAEILDLSNGRIPILIFGVSNIFVPFWRAIQSSKVAYSYYHPSRNHLNRQLKGIEQNKDAFLALGRSNFNERVCRLSKRQDWIST